jgi:UDP-N-acetylmuramyl pentapeptide phosphotransferase/UDP-N-acetylglucosamine-1-phosphate transferase
MGSVGCMPIGFLIGYLLLSAAMSGYAHAALILPAYYVADGGLSWILHGLGNKDGLPTYYYQKAIINGRSKVAVLRYIIGINIMLVFLALRSITDRDIASFHLGLAYVTAFILLSLFSIKKA